MLVTDIGERRCARSRNPNEAGKCSQDQFRFAKTPLLSILWGKKNLNTFPSLIGRKGILRMHMVRV